MIFEEEINFPERIIVIIFLLFLLLALLYAMAILVEKYMLCKKRKMNYSLFSNNRFKIQIQ
jgi:hypothetical protein